MKMPTFRQLMEPTLKALDVLGGSGSIEEIATEVIRQLDLPESITSQMHDPARSSQTEVEYRLAWSRTYLKKYGLITNSARGVWVFTDKYQPEQSFDADDVVRLVRESVLSKKNDDRQHHSSAPLHDLEIIEVDNELEISWKNTLHQTLLGMKPDAFERLTKRLLRENGFVQVEITGRSGDGGIDGKGILKLQNILSYHVVFQCKRYQNSVGPGAIRDFRGAMIGRADKGIFITTGTFTRDAINEAIRDGAPAIDLIDGETLAEMLKTLQLGVKVEMIESVEIDTTWFENI
ncbi:restriction endonuclease [Desulfosarcina sp. OttesenSCG-928-A07]|nr:restriction endonuclease [Desulfosarcina sp. OttesenSCG-928-G17]MDL2328581.1 restriction endonuclease [Desulfosarcina sp. OttesenSCG-928-A07]